MPTIGKDPRTPSAVSSPGEASGRQAGFFTEDRLRGMAFDPDFPQSTTPEDAARSPVKLTAAISHDKLALALGGATGQPDVGYSR
jgi:hypothetical protein